MKDKTIELPPLTPDEARQAARNAELMSGPSDTTQSYQYVMAGALAYAAKIEADRQRNSGLSRQQVIDRFYFLEGVVNEHIFRRITEAAIEIAGMADRQRRGDNKTGRNDATQDALNKVAEVFCMDPDELDDPYTVVSAAKDFFANWELDRKNWDRKRRGEPVGSNKIYAVACLMSGRKGNQYITTGTLHTRFADSEEEAKRSAVSYALEEKPELEIDQVLCLEVRAPATRRAAPVATQQDCDEDAYVIERMSKLLAEIAVIVRGPELPRHRHGYADLPARVAALKASTVAAQPSVPGHLMERLRAHSEDKSNTAFARSAMKEALQYMSSPLVDGQP